MILASMMVMTGILGLGVCVLIVLSATLVHAYGHKVRSERQRLAAECQAIRDESQKCDRQLSARLIEGQETGTCVTRWQDARRDKVPGEDWSWGERELKCWSQRIFQERVGQLKSRTILQAVFSLLAVCLIVGGIVGWLYSAYAAQRTPSIPNLPTALPMNATDSSETEPLFPNLLSPGDELTPPAAPEGQAPPKENAKPSQPNPP